MKIDYLLDWMKRIGVRMPTTGTGRGGRIVARDLQNAIGDHYAKSKYTGAMAKHLKLRRLYTPMKAYRYNKLSTEMKGIVWNDDNEWYEEKKYNGWRIVITYIPDYGFAFWGNNLSDIDCLPVNYTNHVLLDRKYNPRHNNYRHYIPYSCILDTEGVCYDPVEMLDGRESSNSLDGVKAILGSDPDRAKMLQEDGAKLDFYIFDHFSVEDGVLQNMPLNFRKAVLDGLAYVCTIKNFYLAPKYTKGKKEQLKDIWADGEEGVILKNASAYYEAGARKKEIAIKVKRTMSGEIGDDIDAFIIGWIETLEWSKKNLIGGVKLGVFIEDGGECKIHHIATVSSMPDGTRELLSMCPHGIPCLNPEYDRKVVVVDGQELSAKNRMILHATVDWNRGFRQTKTAEDCTFSFGTLEKEKF